MANSQKHFLDFCSVFKIYIYLYTTNVKLFSPSLQFAIPVSSFPGFLHPPVTDSVTPDQQHQAQFVT